MAQSDTVSASTFSFSMGYPHPSQGLRTLSPARKGGAGAAALLSCRCYFLSFRDDTPSVPAGAASRAAYEVANTLAERDFIWKAGLS